MNWLRQRERCSRHARLGGALLLGLCLIINNNAAAGDETVSRLQLDPVGEPDPPLKYQLLPAFEDQIPGNAVVWYGKVFAEQQALLNKAELWNNMDENLSVPLEDLPPIPYISGPGRGSLFHYLEKGARSQSCDWQLPVREEPYYSVLLPEIQRARRHADLLALRSRYEVARQDYTGAIRSLQSGFALARNVSQGETIVCSVVGSSIHRLMMQRVLEMVQQPGAPNLYWALSSLPDPPVDFRPGLQAELDALKLSFPVFLQLGRDDDAGTDWTEQLREFWGEAERMSSRSIERFGPLELLVMRNYPIAKRRMIEDGLDQDTVESMPVARVVLQQSFREYQRRLQKRHRWAHVRYPQAIPELDKEQQAQSNSREILPLSQIFNSNYRAIVTSKTRNRFQLDLARTIEAIRLHAAAHGGQLPNTLADITVVPVPDDPFTGKPFLYELTGEAAVLQTSENHPEPKRYEIEIKPEANPND